MAKVRSKKEHKKRVTKRNNLLLQEKSKMQKAQKAFLMNLIEQEKNRGLFNNEVSPSDAISVTELPTVGSMDLGLNQGPKI